MDERLPHTDDALIDAALDGLRQLGLTALREEAPHRPEVDAMVRIGYGDQTTLYAAEAKRNLRPAALGAVIHQLERLGENALLIADHITPPMAETLRERRIAFVDTAGNAWLDQPPMLIWTTGKRPANIRKAEARGRRAFQATGMQVLFALICNPEWVNLPYRELAARVGVAHGTIGWVMAELPGLGFLATVDNTRKLVQRELLLQQWAAFYPRTLRPRLALGRFRPTNLEWWKTIDAAKYGAVLGGEPAGGRMTNYLRPGTATLYTEKIDPHLLVDLRLRPDPMGDVEILHKFWTFTDKDTGLAPAPLVYADLMATGDGRCMETAKIIFVDLFRHAR